MVQRQTDPEHKDVWDNDKLTLNTEMTVYRACDDDDVLLNVLRYQLTY